MVLDMDIFRRVCRFGNPTLTCLPLGSIINLIINESRHGISNKVVCATSKASDQPAHTRSLIKAFASRLSIL